MKSNIVKFVLAYVVFALVIWLILLCSSDRLHVSEQTLSLYAQQKEKTFIAETENKEQKKEEEKLVNLEINGLKAHQLKFVKALDGNNLQVQMDEEETEISLALIEAAISNESMNNLAVELITAFAKDSELYGTFLSGKVLIYKKVNEDYILLQEELLKAGTSIMQPDTTSFSEFYEEFKKAENVAKENKLGVWGIPGLVGTGGYNTN